MWTWAVSQPEWISLENIRVSSPETLSIDSSSWSRYQWYHHGRTTLMHILLSLSLHLCHHFFLLSSFITFISASLVSFLTSSVFDVNNDIFARDFYFVQSLLEAVKNDSSVSKDRRMMVIPETLLFHQ